MRFTLACVAVLAVFSSCKGEGLYEKAAELLIGAILNTNLVRRPLAPVSNLPATLPSDREMIKVEDAQVEVEVIGRNRVQTPLLEVGYSYLRFLQTASQSDGPFPTVENIADAIKFHLKFASDSLLCKRGSAGPLGAKEEWYDYLCY